MCLVAALARACALLFLSLTRSCFPSLWCAWFGLYPSSQYRYRRWAPDTQYSPGHPEAELAVAAGHEYLSGCTGAAVWTGKGEG